MEFKKLVPSILSVAIIFIGAMVFFSIIRFNLNPVQDRKTLLQMRYYSDEGDHRSIKIVQKNIADLDRILK